MRKLLLLPAVLALTCLAVLPAGAVSAPRSTLGVSTDVRLPKSILSITFTDSTGHHRHLGTFKGTTLFVPFLTLCPEVCPFTTGNAIQVARQLALHHDRRVRVIEFSVDPGRDSVKRLKAYRSMVGLTKNDTTISQWRASARDTAAVMKFFGITTDRMKAAPELRDWMTKKPLKYDLDHSDGFYVLDRHQHLRFISGLSPRFIGTLTNAMKSYLSDDGLNTLAHPLAGWTPTDAIAALSYVANRQF